MRPPFRVVRTALAVLMGVAIVPTACSKFSSSPVEAPDSGVGVATDATADTDMSTVVAANDGGMLVPCGTDACDTSEGCCWLDQSDAGAMKCTTLNECTGVWFRCYDDAECVARGDRYCCGVVDGFRLYGGSTCVAQPCYGTVHLCNYAEDPDPCQDAGLACQPASGPKGFAYCR
jgi:hypothetical protein